MRAKVLAIDRCPDFRLSGLRFLEPGPPGTRRLRPPATALYRGFGSSSYGGGASNYGDVHQSSVAAEVGGDMWRLVRAHGLKSGRLSRNPSDWRVRLDARPR